MTSTNVARLESPLDGGKGLFVRRAGTVVKLSGAYRTNDGGTAWGTTDIPNSTEAEALDMFHKTVKSFVAGELKVRFRR